EEPFDQITSAVQVRTKAECVFSISPWRDVCPRAMLADKCSDPVSIISTVRQEHCSRLQARQELGGKSVVVSFPGCERGRFYRPPHESCCSAHLAAGPWTVSCCERCRRRADERALWLCQSFARPHHEQQQLLP